MFTIALRSFFTLKPKRVANVSTPLASMLAFGIVITQFADYVSTKLGLSIGGTEANGLMATFIQDKGFTAFLILKLSAALFLVWTTWKRPVAATIIIAIYTLVILNNLYAITRYLGY